MNQRLENYIETINDGLRKLPSTEREAEIAELRQHLNALVLTQTELGNTDTEEDAVRGAMMQFGQASVVQRRLVLAYRRRQLAKFRQTWIGAVLCTIFAAFLGVIVSSCTLFPLGRYIVGENITTENLTVFIASFCVALFVECWFIGWFSSRLSSWRCLPVIASWMVFFYCVYVAPQLRHEDMPYVVWIQTVVTSVIIMATPLLSAFLALKRQSVLRRE